MKKLVLSLAMAACLVSGAHAATATTAATFTPGTEKCSYMSYSFGCGGLTKWTEAANQCTQASAQHCIANGCTAYAAGKWASEALTPNQQAAIAALCPATAQPGVTKATTTAPATTTTTPLTGARTG